MVDIFLTVNTHIGYSEPGNTALPFAERYLRKIYGTSRHGDCALPLLLKLFEDNGLPASFFVESLFAVEYEIQPLQDIVQLINDYGQDIQLLLDAQWAVSLKDSIFESLPAQANILSNYSLEQQIQLIKIAKRLLIQSGVKEIQAFREVNLSMSRSMLNALEANDIFIDCSYNPIREPGLPEFLQHQHYNQPVVCEPVVIYPVTIFKAGKKQQLTVLNINTCCFNEIETVLNYASDRQWHSVVVTLTSDVLMTTGQVKLDPVKFKRMKTLCAFLASRSDFNVRGFEDLEHPIINRQMDAPHTQQADHYRRLGEQFVSAVI